MPGGQTSSATTDPAIAGALGAISRWPLRIWVAIELLVALALVRQPLFGVLGYEHALAATLVASPLALAIGATIARRAARVTAPALARARDPLRHVVALAWRACAIAAGVTTIPALVAAVHGLWVPTCDWGFGVRAYLSLVTTSAIIFACVGVTIGLATAGARAWVVAAACVGLVLAIAAVGLWRFYSEPPVFSYSPLAGYIPGNLYDENIHLGAPLYWSRLEQLAWAIAALGAIAVVLDAPTLRPRWRERRPVALRHGTWLLLGGLALAVPIEHAAGTLGFAVDASDIQDELGGRYQSEHFVIHYARTDDIAARIELIAADHEFRLAQAAAVLGLTDDDLRRLGPIDSYYFATSEQKGSLMGGYRVDMAKPWRHEIYLADEAFPHVELRHEIAHVLASSFGDPWFGVASKRVLGIPLLVNPGLIEGLAVAVDWPADFRDSLTPHQQVRALQAMGFDPHLDDVLSLGFLTVSPQRSYTIAGSFVRFLLEQHGPGALRRLYGNGGDFEAAYGKSLDTLEAEWKAMLTTVSITDDQVEMIKERFRPGSVFSRPCPHAVAAKAAAAHAAATAGDRARAITLLRDVCSDSGNDPSYRLALAAALARGDDGERAEAAALFRAIADDPAMTATNRAAALDGLTDQAVAAGDRWTAADDQARAVALPLDENQARSARAERFALEHEGPAASVLRDYFFTPGVDLRALATQATSLEPDLGLAWYLRGLRDADLDPAGSVKDLLHAVTLGLPDRHFVRFAARVLAIQAWRAGDAAAVMRAAELFEGDGATEMDRLLAADWRDRLARSYMPETNNQR